MWSAGLVPSLGGCTSDDGGVPWLFAVLALVALPSAAFVLGLWRERVRHARELQDRSAETTAWRLLQRGATWHTDARHALQSWQAAGPGESEPPPDDSALRAALASERPFRDLAVPAQGADGLRWRFDGEPVRDALGRFQGYRGNARPAALEDESALARAAVGPLIDAWPGPALLAAGTPGRWAVVQFNPAARAHWPGAAGGHDLAKLLDTLPVRVVAALAEPARAANVELEGWQVVRFALDGDREGVLLARAAPGAVGGGEAEAFGPTLSHDLRAPIRVVEGFTRIVKEDYGRQLDRVANDHLDRVLGAAARMNLMIDALLTLSRLSSQPLARQPVNLSQLAGYVIEDLKRSAPERDVEVSIEPGLAVQGDPTLLRLVLENLIGNAWKYTARASRARIALRAAEQDGRRCFQVVDNGAGFDMRSADRLFGLFQRLHSQNDFPGHGVGLASVRRIVQRHGGQIWAQAEPGRGATFSFTLA